MTDYKLTLTYKLTAPEPIDPDELAEFLQYAFQDYRDGRNGFFTEMVTHGLLKNMNTALYEGECRKAQGEFGNEMVSSHGGRGHTAKWYLEATKRHAKRAKPWINSEPTVTLEPDDAS